MSGTAAKGNCPEPDVLLGAVAEVLPEEIGEPVRRHMAECPYCQALHRDLTSAEMASPSEAESLAIRRRIDAAVPAARKPFSWLGWPAWVAAAVGFAALAVSLYLRTAPQVSVPPQPSVTVRQPILPLDKPALKLSPGAGLTWRGGSGGASGESYLPDLGAAMEPYRNDDFDLAAERLGALARRYPDAVEPPFYRGVCLLHLGRADEAAQSFEQARTLETDVLRDDLDWYLGVARERSGRIGEAASLLEGLCAREGPYRERACEAVPKLR